MRSETLAGAPLASARGLSRSYVVGSAQVRAVVDVEIDIEPGDYVGIRGASGSGKSTLLHLLGCLQTPSSGTYALAGKEMSRLGDRELALNRNRCVGFVFQAFHLVPELDVVENVALPFLYSEVGRREAAARARRAIERVGLAHRAGHRPAQLSGGEMQRVAIARAVVTDPMMLLADEPTGNLDARTGEEILDLFDRVNADGTTLVVVSHDDRVAARARRRFQMADGRLEEVAG